MPPAPLEGTADTSSSLGEPNNLYRSSKRASRPLPPSVGLWDPSRPLGGPSDPSWPSVMASRPLSALRDDLLTPPGPPAGHPNPLGGPLDPYQPTG